MECTECAIGFFDSGVGGISVLREAVKLMPQEDYIYFGDSLNAPYGTKSVGEVKELTLKAAELLYNKRIKALVVACNTATSAAINILRKEYKDIPVIGIEPALKPAVELKRNGKVLVMATPMTLAEKKFAELLKSFEEEADILAMPCPGLVELIESGNTNNTLVKQYLEERFKDILNSDIAAVVLGCTHYPFVKDMLKEVLPADTPMIDGSLGTVKQLRNKLRERGKLKNDNQALKGKVTILNSLNNDSIIDFCYTLLNS